MMTHVRGCCSRQDLTGQTFGRLTVLERIKDGRRTYYRCSCECGNETTVRADALTHQKQRSCGKCGYGKERQAEAVRRTFVDGTQPAKIALDKEPTAANRSGHVGVNWDKSRGKWAAGIRFRGKRYNLGRYDDIRDAIAAREAAEKEIYGRFLEWYERYKEEQP